MAGKKSERNVCVAIALPIDAESKLLLASEMSDSSTLPADTGPNISARDSKPRTLPKEVRMRNQSYLECIGLFLDSLGVTVRIAQRLPATARRKLIC